MNRREALAATAGGLAAAAAAADDPPVNPRGKLTVTKLETFLVQPRWLFLKVHTDAGIVGLGEPIVEGRAETIATAVNEIEPYRAWSTRPWSASLRIASDTVEADTPIRSASILVDTCSPDHSPAVQITLR